MYAAVATLILSALVCTGCSSPRVASEPRAFYVEPRAFEAEPRVVSSAEAEVDLGHALRLFAEAYAAPEGSSPLPPAERVRETRERIRARRAWEPRELAALLCALFRQGDGHLAFEHGGERPLRVQALAVRPEVRVAAWGAPPVEFVEGEVPVLAVRTFEAAAAPALEGLAVYARELGRAPAFVLDLRGNHGGNYAFAEALLLALVRGPVRALDTREVLSVAAFVGRANAARRRLARGDVSLAARPVFLEQIERLERLAEEFAGGDGGRVELVRRGEVLWGEAPRPMVGRGVVLVDRGCASACEMLVALARQVPGLVIAGERTRGSMAVGEVASFRLPRSGLSVTLGTRAIVDPLGDFDERRGFSPDVVLEGEDVLEHARKLAAAGDAGVWEVAAARAPFVVPGVAGELRASAAVVSSRRQAR